MVRSTIAALVEAVVGIAMVGEDYDAMPSMLKTDCGVDNKPLGASDA